MGVFSRNNKKGVTWYLRYTHNGEQIIEKVGRSVDGVSKKKAEDSLASRKGDIVQGRFNIAQTKTYSRFSKLLDKYLVYSETQKISYDRDICSSNHLRPFFGNKRINDITSFMVEQYKKVRKDEIKAMPKNAGKADRDISYCSINRELALMKTTFSMAMNWGDIDRNPVRGVKMFPERTRERYLSEEEITALLEACGHSKNSHLKPIVITALSTGARLMEILRLKVRDLDFTSSMIYFEHTKNGDRGKVPMGESLRSFLEEHLKGHKHEYLFCNDAGVPFSDIRKSFRVACKEAGIKDFRFHDLRHTFASQLAMKGIEGITLQRLGRWKTPSMVMRYTHLSESHMKNAVDKLAGLFTEHGDSGTNIVTGDFR